MYEFDAANNTTAMCSKLKMNYTDWDRKKKRTKWLGDLRNNITRRKKKVKLSS
jgi:hypothetical protein